jgi:hypothetical protein
VRLRPSALVHTALVLAALVLTALIASHEAAAQSAAPPGAPLSRVEISAAVEQLRKDPNLGGERKIRSLSWTGSQSTPDPVNVPKWLAGLFEFLGQSSSVLLWMAGAVGVGLAAIWLIRVMQARAPVIEEPAPATAARESELDIRPASLPPDIGAAALALLEAGRTRDALSLLYRGALSRAVHRFGAVIGESFTEGEALKAVNARLDPPRVAYFAQLVRFWQRAVYAGESAGYEPIAHLCVSFTPTLDADNP